MFPGEQCGLNHRPGYGLMWEYIPDPPLAQEISTTVNPRLGALLIILRAKLASGLVSSGRVRKCHCSVSVGGGRYGRQTSSIQVALYNSIKYRDEIKLVAVITFCDI